MKTILSDGVTIQFEISDCIEGMKKFPDDSIDLINTNPPYNSGREIYGINDNLTKKEYDIFNEKWLNESFRVLKPGHHLYFSCGSNQFLYFIELCKKIGYKFRHLLISSIRANNR